MSEYKDAGRINGHHIWHDDTIDSRRGAEYFKSLDEAEAEELFKRAKYNKDRNYFKGDYNRKFQITYKNEKYYLEKYDG